MSGCLWLDIMDHDLRKQHAGRILGLYDDLSMLTVYGGELDGARLPDDGLLLNPPIGGFKLRIYDE